MGRHPLLPPPAVTCLGQGPLLSWARLSWGWRMVSKLDNRKQRVGLSGQQGRRTGSLPGRGDQPGGVHWPQLPGDCMRGLQLSGWVKAGFILPSAAPTSLPTQVWGDPGKMRMGWLSAQQSSSVVAWGRAAPTGPQSGKASQSVILEMEPEG